MYRLIFAGFVLLFFVACGGPAPSPGATIALSPGQNVQSIVGANPAGTTYLFQPGTYARQSITPKTGDTFAAATPGTAILNGDNVSKTAFGGSANNVTIRGLTIENYRSDFQDAAVDSGNGRAWLIESNVIRGNYHIGVNAGTDTRVLNNKILDNGMAGFDGGDSVAGGGGWLFEGNEIGRNNTRHLDWGFEGGGGKVTEAASGTFRGNKVWGNDGPGIWLDGNANNVLIENNEVWDNLAPGIMVEISHSATVRNNKLWGNGEEHDWIHAQILISSAERNKVYGNTLHVDPEHTAIFVNSQGREYDSVENEIYENRIWLRGTQANTTGIDVDDDSDTLTETIFHDNEYHVASLSTRYFSLGPSDLTLTGMQQRGQELGSTATLINPADFNFDGALDAADYTTWRDRNGSAAEYQLWKSRFGQGLAASAVPEPPAWLLAVLVVLLWRRF